MIRPTTGLRLTKHILMPRHRQRSASSASAVNAQPPMKSRPSVSITRGPGGVVAAAASRSRCCQVCSLAASTLPPACTVTVEPLRSAMVLKKLCLLSSAETRIGAQREGKCRRFDGNAHGSLRVVWRVNARWGWPPYAFEDRPMGVACPTGLKTRLAALRFRRQTSLS